MDARVVENPVRVGAQLGGAPVVGDVDAEGCRGNQPLHVLQGAEQLQPLRVRQRSGGIDHAGELHHAFSENRVGARETVAAGGALVFSAGVNGGRASRTDGHVLLITFFRGRGKPNQRHARQSATPRAQSSQSTGIFSTSPFLFS